MTFNPIRQVDNNKLEFGVTTLLHEYISTLPKSKLIKRVNCFYTEIVCVKLKEQHIHCFVPSSWEKSNILVA